MSGPAIYRKGVRGPLVKAAELRAGGNRPVMAAAPADFSPLTVHQVHRPS